MCAYVLHTYAYYIEVYMYIYKTNFYKTLFFMCAIFSYVALFSYPISSFKKRSSQPTKLISQITNELQSAA